MEIAFVSITLLLPPLLPPPMVEKNGGNVVDVVDVPELVANPKPELFRLELIVLLLLPLLLLALEFVLLLLLAKVANKAVVPKEYSSYFNGLLLLEDESNNSVDMENN